MIAIVELILLIAVFVLYTRVAIGVGSRILSYRSEWLDAPVMPNRMVKSILCLLVGWLVTSFYLAWQLVQWCLKIMIK